MDAEVVVVGGGPVGATLSILLRARGIATLALDRARFPRDKACGEGLMPAGAAVLARAGLDLAGAGFPPIWGVRYRLESGAAVSGGFRTGPGFGVRRQRLDALLAERAGVVQGVTVRGVRPPAGGGSASGFRVDTTAGELGCRILVGADGLRSAVARLLGWARPPAGTARHALVGHFEARLGGRPEIVVSLLGGVEAYSAPSGPGELLVAVLGPRGTLRDLGSSVERTYLRLAARAHPELAAARLLGPVRGAGPFRVRPAAVAGGGAFLAGDAAGMLDPLTGDALSAGLCQAEALAGLLAADPDRAAPRYRRWCAAQWRRRRAVGRLALTLTGSPLLARLAMSGLGRRPSTLDVLLEVNQGSRGLGSLGPRDWAALAGL